MVDAAKTKKSAVKKNMHAPTPPRPWFMLVMGAILGAAVAIAITNEYFPSLITTLVTALGFIGPAASFVPLGLMAIIGALFGTELTALAWVYKVKLENLVFLWNVILATSAIAGAGLGLFLAATVPAVFDFALLAIHGAFPAFLPWIFIIGFGFVVSVILAFFAYSGGLAMRRKLATK